MCDKIFTEAFDYEDEEPDLDHFYCDRCDEIKPVEGMMEDHRGEPVCRDCYSSMADRLYEDMRDNYGLLEE